VSGDGDDRRALRRRVLRVAACGLPLLLAMACGGNDGGGGGDAVPHPLEPSAYRFCHDAGVDAEEVEPWCEVADEIPPERCPGLLATCDGAEPVESGGCQDAQEGSDGPAELPAAEPEEPDSDMFAGLDADGLSSLLRWVMALLVAFGVFLLARVLWTFFGRDAPARPDEPVSVELPDPPDDDALPEVPAAPSDDLLSMARRALEEDRPGEAAVLARGAALRHLGERGVLRLHRSKTDREYVRAVAGAEQRDALRSVVRIAESYRFGKRRPPAGAARKALEAATRIVQSLSVVLMIGLLSSSALAQSAHDRFGPSGDAALIELFRLWGYDASWRLRPIDRLSPEIDALVLDTTGIDVPDEAWPVLSAWVEEGGVLVVAGDAAGFPSLGDPEVFDDEATLSVVGPAALAALDLPVLPSPPVLYQGGGGVAWVVSDDGHALVTEVSVGRGAVLGIADAELLYNASLAMPANERFLGDLLTTGQAVRGWPLATPIKVQLLTAGAMSVNSSGAPQGNNPLGSLSSAQLLPFVLHLLAVWTLVALWQGWPFGPRRDPTGQGRLRFADHVEAIGERHRRMGASRHALASYAALWLSRLGPAGLQLAAQNAGMAQDEAARWVEGLEAVVDMPDGPDDEDDVQRMEELWKVVQGR